MDTGSDITALVVVRQKDDSCGRRNTTVLLLTSSPDDADDSNGEKSAKPAIIPAVNMDKFFIVHHYTISTYQ